MRATNLLMRIENDKTVYFGKMSKTALPTVTEGRLGLRHMQTRPARFKNFRVSDRVLPSEITD